MIQGLKCFEFVAVVLLVETDASVTAAAPPHKKKRQKKDTEAGGEFHTYTANKNPNNQYSYEN